MYLDLKRRIPVVAEWTEVGEEDMQRAQERIGLSDERLARLIPVSERTWRRWKKRGAIPTALLPRVAEVLDLELVKTEPVRVDASRLPELSGSTRSPYLLESSAATLDLLRSIGETLLRVEDVLLRIERATREQQPVRTRGAPPR
jgi:DNA-binding transcriptional regulator YiaG